MLAARQGFTLTEMLIVVIIVGATAAVVAPQVSKGAAQSRVRRAASIVAGDLELAFANAARQRKPIRVTFDAANKQYTVMDRSTNTVLFTRSFGSTSDLALESFTASAATLDIYPHGIASGPDTLVLRIGTRTRKVTVTRAGVIRGFQ